MEDKIRVLIVDDERSEREVSAGILKENNGLHLEEAGNGKEALEKIKRSIPDIVLCDLNMPEVDGLELVMIIKDDSSG